ncbi:MAG: PVC-type heme-binding CxxCH protein, partial [Planctomycetaceae bacterium]
MQLGRSLAAALRVATLFIAAALMANTALAAPPTPKVIASTPPADDLPIVPAAEAAKAFKIPDGLEVEVALAEPEVRQPLFITWDERGRMWVVQYLQYPEPAGLKMVSRDEFWRVVYDKVPPAPPNHIPGLDKITIHEDSDGDGRFDKHKTFVAGLSIVSACEVGRDGVWVLNPPYLLFYPDKNHDDVPDGDPVVHLQGFGIEDTHSVANSLRWGSDGWLYGAQGSTVSGHIVRPGDKKSIDSMGQVMWRYHPELRRYEIFAEGGGNAFSCEITSDGRIFSGHNGGNTRGFHYVQGGYYQKGFAKHGPLSNPYAFGYFNAMTHHDVPRFSHNFLIDEGGALPAPFRGRLYGVEPLAARVVMSDVSPEKSSFKTKDVGFAMTTEDRRFRPVEIKTGPDGAIYVADMYEPRIAHREHFQGHIDKATGRIYRLKAKGAAPVAPFDLSRKSSEELVTTLEHPNKWFVHAALRLLGDRKDSSLVPVLKEKLKSSKGRLALQYLFALNLSGGLDEQETLNALGHSEPTVREWAVRLACDTAPPGPEVSARIVQLAASEPDVHVRSQLAASARRMSPESSVAVVASLMKHDEDADDIHIPLLLWWAVESRTQSPALLALFDDAQMWKRPIVSRHLLSRLMQRYATSGLRADLDACTRLLKSSPDAESSAQL